MDSIQPPDTYTRFLHDMFDDRNMIAVSTGFQRFYNNPANGGHTSYMFGNEAFDGQVIRASKPIAALYPRGVNSKIIEEEEEKTGEFSEFSRVFPLGRRISNIHANELLKRVPGESPYDPWTKERRLRSLAVTKSEDKIRASVGLLEYLAAQMILTGKMPAILGTEDPKKIFDYRRDIANTITENEYWNSANAKIIAFLDTLCDKIVVNGKTTPDMAIFGADAFDAYLSDTKVKEYHDNRRMDLGMVSENVSLPERLQHFTGEGGFQFRGKLTTPKGRELYLFTYDHFYEKPKGTIKWYMPKDEVLVASSRARCDRFFGPGEALPQTRIDRMWYEDMFGFSDMNIPLPANMPQNNALISPEMFHFKSFPSEDKVTIRIVVEFAPVYGTAQTDGFARGNGLIDYIP